MIPYITLTLLALLTIEISLKPRLDRTINGDLLLWYGTTKRKNIKL